MRTEHKTAAYWHIVFFVLKLVAIATGVMVWLVEAERALDVSLVPGVTAPDYVDARDAWDSMVDQRATLRSSDPGFAQILAVLGERVASPIDQVISMKIVQSNPILQAPDSSFRATTLTNVDLEMTFVDGTTQDLWPEVNTFEEEIQTRFLDSSLFRVQGVWFYVGIAFGVVGEAGPMVMELGWLEQVEPLLVATAAALRRKRR